LLLPLFNVRPPVAIALSLQLSKLLRCRRSNSITLQIIRRGSYLALSQSCQQLVWQRLSISHRHDFSALFLFDRVTLVPAFSATIVAAARVPSLPLMAGQQHAHIVPFHSHARPARSSTPGERLAVSSWCECRQHARILVRQGAGVGVACEGL
jgi:hypothetical protein